MPRPTTLLTSPPSAADFCFRLAFFATAPLALVVAAALFPVRGALIDVGLALLVFASGEAVRRFAGRWRVLDVVLAQAYDFERYYRERPPRSFAYYVFYPLLFPYWATVAEARREFLVFRSYTLGSAALLVGSLTWQFFADWRPQLGLRDYWPFVVVSFVIETLLVLALLMPIATTVVWYESRLHRGRLLILLFAGLLSTGVSLAYVAQRRDPVVSYAARERVRLRTLRDPRAAHRALRRAAMAGLLATRDGFTADADDIVLGTPIEAARRILQTYYKHDEAHAFNLWVSQRHRPEVIVLYFRAEPHKAPIWVGIRRDGHEVSRDRDLPRGAAMAMRRAEGADAQLWTWPQELDDNLFLDQRP